MKTNNWIFLAVLLALLACSKDDEPHEFFVAKSVSVKSSTIPADKFTTTVVTVELNKHLDSQQEVTFTTSEGALFKMPFNPNEKDTNRITFAPNSETVKLLLRSSQNITEEVFVSATVNSFSNETIVSFTQADPNDMLLTADKFSLAINESATVKAELIRNRGLVSNQIKFMLSDTIISDTNDVKLNVNYPDFVFSDNGELNFNLDVLQHSVGAELELFVQEAKEENPLRKSIVLKFE